MKIVYLGSPLEAVYPLQFLLQQKAVEVVGVVSQPAKLVGRGRNKSPQDPPVAQFAKNQKIPTYQPESAKAAEFLQIFKALAPDIAITCAYGQILSSAFLSIPKRATINIHPSKLPEFRGATPVQSALLAGLKNTAVTILFTVRKLDAGNIIVQKDFAIEANENAKELLERLLKSSGPLILESLKKLENPEFIGEPQDETKVTHCKKIAKEDAQIDWQLSSSELKSRFLAFQPWPGFYTTHDGKRVLIEKLKESVSSQTLLAPGQAQLVLLQDGKNHLEVGCSNGALALELLKMEGKSSQDAKNFCNGIRKKDGIIFAT